MRSANLIRRAELIHRAERWPVPMIVLVATCLIMTVTAVWAQDAPEAGTFDVTSAPQY